MRAGPGPGRGASAGRVGEAPAPARMRSVCVRSLASGSSFPVYVVLVPPEEVEEGEGGVEEAEGD